jgi:hypothetical protein
MDSYVRAYVKTHVHIDAGGRAWCDGRQLEVIKSGGQKKIQLPIAKYLLTFDEIKRCGGRVDVPTVTSLAQAGAEGRWKEVIAQREQRGIPANVYVANARTVQRAIDRGETPPDVTWVGRSGHKCTEVYDTVDEVVAAMGEGRWRTEYRRGRYAKKGAKK